MKINHSKLYKKFVRENVLEQTRNDNAPRFANKVVPNKKKSVKKFDYRNHTD